MSKMTDKVSYLKGLAAGMKLNMEKDSNKLMLEILNAMGEMAEEMQAMTAAHEELNEYVESIDDDLADLEETLFGDDDDIDDVDEDDDFDDDDIGDVDEDDELIGYACPFCGHELQFKASDVDFDEDYLCPACGKPVFPEIEEGEDVDPTDDSDE